MGQAYEASNNSGKALQLYRSGMINLASVNRNRLSCDGEVAESELVPI
ncbi:MAG: hypothetical protein ACJATK_003056 [Paracoccaceae bacterium]